LLANAVIAMSIAIAVTKLLDIFLSDLQKKHVENAVAVSWNVLDDLSRKRLLERLGAPYVKIVVCVLGFSVASAAFYYDDERSWDLYAVIALFTTLQCPLLSFILSDPHPRPVFVRTIVVIAISIGVALFSFWLITFTKPLPQTGMPPSILTAFLPFSVSGNQFALAVFFVVILFFFWSMFLLILIPIIAVLIAKVVLVTGEFVVRRVAEYPKGPILTGSAILGVGVSIIKALMGT
jgi:hypothetical protein